MEQVDVKVNYNQSEEEMEVRRGPWTVEEDFTLINYIAHHGEGRWNSLARCAGLNRTGKSCRLRWLNYLRPDVRRGNITLEEQLLILELHSRWGNRWSKIAQHLPGRTDNEIKNYWRTRVQKHAKQLKCDVNSKQFKDTMRYLWMPRLVERIQAAAAAAAGTGDVTGPPAMVVDSSSSATTTCDFNSNQNNIMNLGQLLINPAHPMNTGGDIHTYSPENSSAVASSDSFETPISDLTECYNNYPVNNQGNNNNNNNNNQEYYCPANQQQQQQQLCCYGDQSLISPTAYFNQGLDLMEQNSQWMSGEDISDNLWNVDDMWFLQEQFNSSV